MWSKRSNRFLEFRTIPSNTMDSSATDNQGCSKWRVFSFPFISFNFLNPIYWTKCSCGLKKRSSQSGLTTLRQSWGRADDVTFKIQRTLFDSCVVKIARAPSTRIRILLKERSIHTKPVNTHLIRVIVVSKTYGFLLRDIIRRFVCCLECVILP